MISRINISSIIASHLKTIRKVGRKGIDIWGIIFFFGLPALVSYFIVYRLNLKLDEHISDMLTVVSIVGGFLFNLLAMIYTIIEKVKEKFPENAVKNVYAKEIHSNISFSILLAMACSLFLLVYSIDFNSKSLLVDVPYATSIAYHLNKILLCFNFFLLGSFFLTLLMVLKRIFIIMDNDS